MSTAIPVRALLPALLLTVGGARAAEPWHTLEGHKGDVRCVAISPDGKRVASGGADGTIRIWDVATGKQLFSLDASPAEVDCLTFRPDGRTLIVSSSHTRREKVTGHLIWWDLAKRRPVRRLDFPFCLFMRLSPDGKTLVTGSGEQNDHHVKIRDPETGKELASLLADEYPGAPAFSPDSKLLAIGGGSRLKWGVRIWDVQTRKQLASYGVEGVRDLAFSPDGTVLASGHDALQRGNGLRLYLLKKPKKGSQSWGLLGSAYRLAFTRDGKYLLATGIGQVSVLDAETGKVIKRLPAHYAQIPDMAVSRDGRLLVTAGGGDETVRLWRLDRILPPRPRGGK
jgi:WD40 repeat protein